ncbi:DUF1801 domain-containing protein [Aquipuribacter sp. SD81]|uniref:DUF1801 domain-containing protein n=1 Tax=Aquipuribacter sp. SD81 TaxID=3127703 RepID=UPI0030164E93
MPSAARTAAEYIAELPEQRRGDIHTVLDVVRASMPDGYVETMAFGMITWVVPVDVYPDTYNGRPLQYVALASQKRHGSLYLMGLYADHDTEQRFRERWSAGGRRLDMGRSCIRFRRADDLDLGLVAEAVGGLAPDDFVALYERSRAR